MKMRVMTYSPEVWNDPQKAVQINQEIEEAVSLCTELAPSGYLTIIAFYRSKTTGDSLRESCMEFLKGCADSPDGQPEACKACTVAFRKTIQDILEGEEHEIARRD